MLQEVDFITEKVNHLRSLPVPPEGFELQEVILQYYRGMLEVQAAVLKFISDIPGASQAVETATHKVIDLEKSFQSEMTRMKKLAGVERPGENSKEVIQAVEQKHQDFQKLSSSCNIQHRNTK